MTEGTARRACLDRPINVSPPIHGRIGELETLLRSLAKAISGKGQLVLIFGEAGIGKTRLVEEFETFAFSARCQVLVGRCIPGAPCPYLPFREAFSRHGRGPSDHSDDASGDEQIEQSNPFLQEPVQEHRDFVDQDSKNVVFMLKTLEYLKLRSTPAPLVIVLEDMHWADSASIQLIHFLARNILDLPILIMGTYRPEDLVPIGDGGSHPLQDSMRAMKREGLFEEIRLDRLPDAEVVKILSSLLPSPLDGATADRIVRVSEGNPLFAIEVLNMLIGNGSIIEDGGYWKPRGNIEPTIPATVKEVILSRIDRLSKSERNILECASVIGETFDPALVAEIGRVKALEVLEELDFLDHFHKLVKASDNRYRFYHESIRSVIYGRVSNIRKREIHRLVGEHIERRVDESRYGDLSHHFFHAMVRGKSVKYSLLAGDACLDRSALSEASTYYQRALSEIGDDPVMVSERIRALEGLGDTTYEQSRYEQSVSYYSELLVMLQDGTARARALRKCSDCYAPSKLGKGSYQRHEGYLSEAMACRDIDPFEMAEILSTMAMEELWKGDFEKSRTLMSQAEDIFQREGAFKRLAHEQAEHGFVFMAEGKTIEALQMLQSALELLSKNPWPKVELYTNQYTGETFLCMGRLDKCREIFLKNIDICDKLGEYYEGAWAHFYIALIGDMTGDQGLALKHAEMAYELSVLYGYDRLGAMPGALLSKLYEERGETARSDEMLRRVKELVGPIDLNQRSPLWGWAMINEAYVLYLKGKKEAGRMLFAKGIDIFHGVQLGLMYEALGRAWFACWLEEEGKQDDADHQRRTAAEIFEGLNNLEHQELISHLTRRQGAGPDLRQ